MEHFAPVWQKSGQETNEQKPSLVWEGFSVGGAGGNGLGHSLHEKAIFQNQSMV